jgi:hypothetical protein
VAYPIDHLAASYASVVADFVDASNQVTPHRLPALVAEAAAGLGSRTARVWLADHHQRTLRHLPAGTPEESLSIDGTSGGRAFISTKVVDHVDDVGNHHLWLPMLDGVDRLGVLEVESGPLDPGQHVALGRLATFAASALAGRGRYTDAFTLTRRREQMSLAAELQWQMLPPGTFAADDVSVAGMMEPAYDIGGDSFDYSHEPDRLRFAIFDAVGHDLASSAISSLTVGAYRNSRRRGRTLLAMAEEMDQVTEPRSVTAPSPPVSSPSSTPPPACCAGSTPDIPRHCAFAAATCGPWTVAPVCPSGSVTTSRTVPPGSPRSTSNRATASCSTATG